MSGEFREGRGSYLWSILEDISDDGEHEVSRVLYGLYKAIAPIETACAYYEASDSTASQITLALYQQKDSLRNAVDLLSRINQENTQLVETILKKESTQELGFRGKGMHLCPECYGKLVSGCSPVHYYIKMRTEKPDGQSEQCDHCKKYWTAQDVIPTGII